MAVRKQPKQNKGSGQRAVLYLRVSSEEQVQGYSLDAQERAGRAWCDQHGAQLVGLYTDEGRSARSDDIAKRPDFKRMLVDVEAGIADVVVVHKLDRFARNRTIAFETFNRLGIAGVGFVSIAENMDYSTPAGQLMLTMLVGLAQFYSDNLSFETSKGKQERKRQGLYNGLLPFAVTRNAAGIPVLDTDARCCNIATRSEIVPANGLVFAFELAAAGKSDREIAKALTDAGYRTSGNRGQNPFSKDTVRVILQNRFYLGELPDGQGGWVPGKHGPLIDAPLFEKAEAARAANTRRPRRTAGPGTPWSLSGLATCSCGAGIVANSRPGGRRSLRCYGRIQGNGCDEPSVYEDALDEQLTTVLSRFAVPEQEQVRMVNAWRRHQSAAVDTAAVRIRIRRRQERLRELYLDGDLDKADYQAQKAALNDELASLPPEGDPHNGAGKRLASFLSDVGRAWQVATPDERNRLARHLFAEAIVENRTLVAVRPRADLLPFFQSVNWCEGGSDGGRGRVLELFAPCRVLVPDFRPQPLQSTCGSGLRYSQRAKSLSSAEEAAIRALASRKSLRSLAAQFGVSHETIRTVLAQGTSPRSVRGLAVTPQRHGTRGCQRATD